MPSKIARPKKVPQNGNAPIWITRVKPFAAFVLGLFVGPFILEHGVGLWPEPTVTYEIDSRTTAPARGAAGCQLFYITVYSHREVKRIDLQFQTAADISDSKFSDGETSYLEHGLVQNSGLYEVGHNKSGECVVVQASGSLTPETFAEVGSRSVRLIVHEPPDEFTVSGLIAMRQSAGAGARPLIVHSSFEYEILGVTTSKEIAELPASNTILTRTVGPNESTRQRLPLVAPLRTSPP